MRAVHNQGHPAAHTCCCLHAAGTRPAPRSSSHCPRAHSAPSSHLHCRGQALSIGSCLWRGDGLRPLDSPWWDASMAPETQSCSEWHAALGPCGGGGGGIGMGLRMGWGWDGNGEGDGWGWNGDGNRDGDGDGWVGTHTPFTSAHWEQLCSLVTPHLHFQALLGPHAPPCPVPPHAHLVARPHGLGSAHLHPC